MFECIKKPKIYVSHPISGNNDSEWELNCYRAHKCVERLRHIFPDIYWYCPGDANWLIRIIYMKGKVKEKDILLGDCEILRSCDGWIFLRWEDSKGSEIERKEAEKCGLIDDGFNHDIYDDLLRAGYQTIRKRLMPIVDETINRYRNKEK